jgi:hypothetical protein
LKGYGESDTFFLQTFSTDLDKQPWQIKFVTKDAGLHPFAPAYGQKGCKIQSYK